MPKIRWKSLLLVLMIAFLAYAGIFALGHIVKVYVQWGYPPWAHIAAGILFLSAAACLQLRRTRWLGVFLECCVLAPAAVSCGLHGDYAHSVQGLVIIGVTVWLVIDRRAPVAS